MHWSNGKFHGNILVNENIYITDYKHLAIHGDKNTVIFGSQDTNTNINGNNIHTVSANETIIESTAKPIYIKAKNGSIELEATTNINLNSEIKISNSNYGTSLPTSGNYEGRIFFKLIS